LQNELRSLTLIGDRRNRRHDELSSRTTLQNHNTTFSRLVRAEEEVLVLAEAEHAGPDAEGVNATDVLQPGRTASLRDCDGIVHERVRGGARHTVGDVDMLPIACHLNSASRGSRSLRTDSALSKGRQALGVCESQDARVVRDVKDLDCVGVFAHDSVQGSLGAIGRRDEGAMAGTTSRLGRGSGTGDGEGVVLCVDDDDRVGADVVGCEEAAGLVEGGLVSVGGLLVRVRAAGEGPLGVLQGDGGV
jgi:hypothetical protein